MDISICPYKYILGKPKEGVRTYRIFCVETTIDKLLFG